jgi:hypothetical protein
MRRRRPPARPFPPPRPAAPLTDPPARPPRRPRRPRSDAASLDCGQPIKRTRSDQSLSALVALLHAAGGPGATGASSGPLPSLPKHAAAAPPPPRQLPQRREPAAPQGARPGPWQATLPAVASEHGGSSTNSLVSADSDATRGAPAAAAAAQPPPPPVRAAPRWPAARPAPPQAPVPGGDDEAPARREPSVTYLPSTGSACSLQHGALGGGAAAAGLLHVYSDASDLMGSCSDLFHADAPRSYSPSPLMPAAPAAPAPVRCVAAAAPAAPAAAPVAALGAVRSHAAPAAAAGGWGLDGGGGPPVFAAAAAAFGTGSGWGHARGGGFGRSGRTSVFSMLDADAAPPQRQRQAPQQPEQQQQQQQQPLSPAGRASGEPESWDFAARARQQREAAKSSGSSSMGRRRSSIEASMPWRAKLDSAIAAAADGDGGEPDGAAAPGDSDAGAGPMPVVPEAGSGGSSAGSSGARSSLESESDGSGAPRGASASGSGSDEGRSPTLPGGGPRLRAARASQGSATGCSSGYYSRQNAGGAAFELFVRLNRSRQTLGARTRRAPLLLSRRAPVRPNPPWPAPTPAATPPLTPPPPGLPPRPPDFAKRQAQEFAELDKAELTVWEALGALDELHEFEADLSPPGEGLDPGMSLREHAFQVRRGAGRRCGGRGGGGDAAAARCAASPALPTMCLPTPHPHPPRPLCHPALPSHRSRSCAASRSPTRSGSRWWGSSTASASC